VTLPTLLGGLMIAMGLFASLGWSVVRALQLRGPARAWHAAHAAMILIGMALVSAEWAGLSRIAGVVLVSSGVAAARAEAGASKLLPLLGAAFGIALLLGLPFGPR